MDASLYYSQTPWAELVRSDRNDPGAKYGPYVFNPDDQQLSLLPEIWPYDKLTGFRGNCGPSTGWRLSPNPAAPRYWMSPGSDEFWFHKRIRDVVTPPVFRGKPAKDWESIRHLILTGRAFVYLSTIYLLPEMENGTIFSLMRTPNPTVHLFKCLSGTVARAVPMMQLLLQVSSEVVIDRTGYFYTDIWPILRWTL